MASHRSSAASKHQTRLVCINCFDKPHLARGTDVSAVRTEVDGDYRTVVRSQHSSKRVLLCRAVRLKYNEREGKAPKARAVSCKQKRPRRDTTRMVAYAQTCSTYCTAHVIQILPVDVHLAIRGTHCQALAARCPLNVRDVLLGVTCCMKHLPTRGQI